MPKNGAERGEETATSNVIGMNAGQEKYGFPLITRG
jgi:hypothetical protein